MECTNRHLTSSQWMLICIYVLSSVFLCCGHPRFINEQTKSYKGHHLVRITPEAEHHLTFLKELQEKHEDGAEFWRHPVSLQQNVDMRLSPEIAQGILPLLNDSGLKYNVISDDIHVLMEAERSKRSLPDQEPVSNFSLTSYHPYHEIESWLDEVNAQCGDHCELIDIGATYEGRRMRVFKIGVGSDDNPAIWIDAGIHAREWVAPATAMHIISKLVAGQESDRVNRYLVNRYTWYILPVANPDGYVHTWTTDRLWRKTRSRHHIDNQCLGVDPNRNWAFHWGGEGTSDNPCSENYHGPVPFSEPEAQNMARFLLSVGDKMAIYLSLHSYGQYWLTPWGYTTDVPDDYLDMVRMGTRATNSMRRNHGSAYQVGSSSRLLYLAAGGSDDWAKGVLGVKYAYTVELRDTGRHGFMLPPRLIEATAREMMNAARSLAVGVLRERKRAARRRRRNSRVRA